MGATFAAALVASPRMLEAAGPATVNLRSAAPFTILAGAAITTTGGGLITGDVGASPITGAAIHVVQSQVTGTIYEVDATGPAGAVVDPTLLTAAQGDLTTAYNDAAGRLPAPTGPFLNPGAGNLGGLTLVPGLYKFTGTALITGGNVTLAGGPNDVWIFQVAADLEEGSMMQVILAGGAQAKNIFWQVGTSATIGTFAVFKGTIMANQAITMNTTSAMDGRALASVAGVTFDGDVGGVTTADAPFISSISRTTATSVTVIVNSTPSVLVSLQSSPSLSSPIWTTIATDTPSSGLSTFIDNGALAAQLFYRAFTGTTTN
jgi:hypothetical protein